MLFLISIFTLSMSSLLSTLSGKDLQISADCMYNKHPCVLESIDCSVKLFATSFSLLNSVKQLLTMIDPDYSSKPGSIKSFPGMQSGALMPKASNIILREETPELARYNCYYNGKANGWAALINNTNQYFQVGSSIPFVYEGLKISGRNDFNHWIASYKISYSLDGVDWISYKNSEIFIANSNSKEPVEQVFEPFVARAVKILPQTWVSCIGGRFEFYISKAIYSNMLPSNTLIPAVASGCKVTSSSEYDHSGGVSNSGFDFQSPTSGFYCWRSALNDLNQWIMVTSIIPVKWKRIGTMGDSGSDPRITSYYIMYSVDGSVWQEYKNKKVFIGNTDRTSKVEYDLEETLAISIRIHPLTWNVGIAGKIEAYFILV